LLSRLSMNELMPQRLGYWPVSNPARDGEQMGEAE
jgi:hypothetical protein